MGCGGTGQKARIANADQETAVRTTLSALALTVALSGPLVAQEARLSGTAAEVFGTQIVVATPEGRVLVTLPEGTAAPAPGARITVAGQRSGQTLTATSLAETGPARPLPAGAAADPASLPAELAALGPIEVLRRGETGRRGHEDKLYLRLADGGWMKAEVRGGRLVEAKAEAGLPAALVSAMLPVGIADDAPLRDMTSITEIDLDDDRPIEVKGLSGDGARIEVKVSRGGGLVAFERKRDDRRGPTGTAASERLAGLGYTDVAILARGGRHVEAVATNPYGERVEVRLSDRGAVDRERMLMR